MEAAFRDEAERGEIVFRLNKAGANPNSRVRLTKAPAKKAVAASSVPEKKSTVAVKTAIPASSSASPGVPANAPKKLSDAEVEKRVLAAIRELQTDENGVRDASVWVRFANLGSRLKEKGVDGKTAGFSTFAKFVEERFADRLEFDGDPNARRTRPKRPGAALEKPDKLSDLELERRVLAAIRALQTNVDGERDASVWIDFEAYEPALRRLGIDFNALGYSTLADFLRERFGEKVDLLREGLRWKVRVRRSSSVGWTVAKSSSTAVVPVARMIATASTVAEKTPVAANALTVSKKETAAVVPVAKRVSTPQTAKKLSDAELEKRVLAALRALQKDDSGRRDPSAWVDFTVLGSRLKAVGVDCKAFGCASYAKLLEARFSKTLQFDKNEPTAWRVRPTLAPNKDDAELADWAVVAPERFDELAKLALPEKWRFDDAEPAPGEPRFPILETYIKYTFRQLAFEGKVKIAPTEDVAAFNTGLFDRNFDPIFAFFRKNAGPEPPLWRLSSFAVVAQDADGKELVARFEPLPKRARFFERREDLVFDGDAAILCDVEHCLVENVARLPSEFLRRYCSPAFLTLEIDGETRTLDAVAARPEKDPARRRYFKALEKRLSGSSELFEMKLRFDAAVELAKKRVAANFRTAVPSFNPRKRNVCYLLPLTLIARREAPERADVALVVERFPETGVYQGHTVYTLDMAYQTARLTARLGGENWLDG